MSRSPGRAGEVEPRTRAGEDGHGAGDGARPSRRAVLTGASGAALGWALPWAGPSTARAQSYPARPITVIVPFSAGGNVDVTARLVTEAMTRTFPGRFVIDNRPGAGGVIGVEALLRAEADGYTLVAAATGSLAVAPKLLTRKSFSSADLAAIGPMATTPMVLEVNAKSPHRTFADLVAYARANPGRLTIGHAGYGTTNHVAILLVQRALGVTLNVVPYRGSAPAITDLLGGQIDAVMDQISSSIGYLKGGTFRPLAVTTRARAGDIPDTPSLDELGLKDFDAGTTVGLLAPARTPPGIVATLNAALNAALREPDVDGRLRALGAVPRPSSPDGLMTLLRGEEEKADLLIRDGVLKPE